MFLSAEQIRTKAPQANDAIRQSFAILRFYSAQQTNELLDHCKRLMARLLADISACTCEAKLLLDLLAQEHEELLVPKMSMAYCNIIGERSRQDLSSVKDMLKEIEATIRRRTGIIDEHLELSVSKHYLVTPYATEPIFRDIDQALVLMQELDDANAPIEAQSTVSAEEVSAMAAILQAKQRNLAIDRSQQLRSLISAYASAEKALNACYVAQILRNQFNLLSSRSVEDFLMHDLATLMQLSWNALTKYYQ